MRFEGFFVLKIINNNTIICLYKKNQKLEKTNKNFDTILTENFISRILNFIDR